MAWGRVSVILLAISIVACSEEATPAAPGGGVGGSGGSVVPPTGGAGGDAGTGGSAIGGSSGMSGAGGSAGTAGSGGSGGTGGSGGQGGVGGIVQPDGACENAEDLGVYSPIDPAVVRAESARCALEVCNGDPPQGFAECIADCVQLTYELSEDCALCYGDLEACSTEACATECSNDACVCPVRPDCNVDGVVDYSSCQVDLSDCTGRIPPECRPA